MAVEQEKANARDRMNLEGEEAPVRQSTLLSTPSLRHVGSNLR
jgi:hypothetical protein